MKALIYLSCLLLLFACASSGTSPPKISADGPGIYIRAKGEGSTQDRALDQALRISVERASGVVINSQLEVTNNRLSQDSIVNYSSGFVHTYEVVNSYQKASGQFVVEIDALVSSNKLAERILGRPFIPNDAAVNGEKMYGQAYTTLKSRYAGDALLLSLLKDYPKDTFIFNLDSPKTVIDQNRQITIQIPFKITWAKNYLIALKEAVNYVAPSYCVLLTNKYVPCEYDLRIYTSFISIDSQKGYKFADKKQTQLLIDRFQHNLKLVIRLYDEQDQVMYQQCFPVDLTDQNNGDQYKIRNLVVNSYTYLNISDASFSGIANVQVPNLNILKRLKRTDARLSESCTVN